MRQLFFINLLLVFLSTFLSANSSAKVALTQSFNSLDGKKIERLYNKQKFTYKIDLKNLSKQKIKDLNLSLNIPLEFRVIKIKKGSFSCKNKDSQLTCTKKSLALDHNNSLEIMMQADSLDSSDISTVVFINYKTDSGDFSDSDLKEIKISQKKPYTNQNSGLDLLVDNDTPKVGQEVHFVLNSKVDATLKIKHDKNLNFQKNSNCKTKEGFLECEINKGDSLKLIAKAIKQGLSICDFVLNSKSPLSIPIDIQRDFKPIIPISTKSNFAKLQTSQIFHYMIDLNATDLNKTLSDPKIVIKTTSDINYKFQSVDNSKWSCKQSKSFLVCKASMLKKGSVEHLDLTLEAPNVEGRVEFEVGFDYMKDRLANGFDVVDLDFDSDHTATMKKAYELTTNSKAIMFGDSVMKLSDVYHISSEDTKLLPKSKLLWVKKRSCFAKLNLLDDEKIVSAKLYWSGRVDRLKDKQMIYEANRIKFFSGKDKNPKILRSKIDDFYWKNSDNIFYYFASVDVSDYLKRYKNGDYFVSNLQASEGFGADGVWRVVVITKRASTHKEYHLKLFEGFVPLWKSKRFKQSLEFDDKLSIELDPKLKLDRVALFSSGSDSAYEDRLQLLYQGNMVYEKIDTLQNIQFADIDTSKILSPHDRVDRVDILSLGDQFFLSFVLLEQESF